LKSPARRGPQCYVNLNFLFSRRWRYQETKAAREAPTAKTASESKQRSEVHIFLVKYLLYVVFRCVLIWNIKKEDFRASDKYSIFIFAMQKYSKLMYDSRCCTNVRTQCGYFTTHFIFSLLNKYNPSEYVY